MRRNLRTQLSLTILTVLLLVIGLISAFANFVINRQFESYLAEQETVRSKNIVSDLGGQWNAMTKTWNKEYIHAVGMYSLYDGYILKILDNNNQVIWDAENHDMTLCAQIMSDIITRMEKEKKSGDFDSHTFDVVQSGQKIGSVIISYYGPYFYSESDFRFINALNKFLLYIGLTAFAVAIITGLLLARRITRPVSRAAEAAKRISKGDYAVRIKNETNTSELEELISAINHLSSALEEQEKLRRQLTADVAHELRTPLTSVGSHLEAMIEGIWEPATQRLQSCREEVLRLGSIVGDLEQLARVENQNLKLDLILTDVWEVVQSVAPAWEAEARKQNIKFSVSGSKAIVPADKDRLAQVVMNLLSNAVKYTPENGEIDVSVFTTEQSAVLEIRDSGIGIPEGELPFIFERFYRTDKSRNRKSGGAGIGLAIVKSIVTAHGGTITVESKNGGGSKFTVKLPGLK